MLILAVLPMFGISGLPTKVETHLARHLARLRLDRVQANDTPVRSLVPSDAEVDSRRASARRPLHDC